MITLEFYDPSGNTEITQQHASRLNALAGKRIGFLSNDQWQAYRTLPLIKTLLEEDFPTCDLLPLETFPQGIRPMSSETTANMVKDRGVDAVIIGNAA